MKKIYTLILICSALFANAQTNKDVSEINACFQNINFSGGGYPCDTITNMVVFAFPGVQPFTYLWSNGQTTQTATGLTPGTYSVTITDSTGCQGIGKVTYAAYPKLTASVTHTNITSIGKCDGTAQAQAQGGYAPYTYNWCTGHITALVTGLCPGTCCVEVTDGFGCTDTACFEIEDATGMTALSKSEDFILYPNPVNDILTIQFGEMVKEQASFHIFDALGREFDSAGQIKNDRIEIDVSIFPAGIYFLKIKEGEMERMKKILVE